MLGFLRKNQSYFLLFISIVIITSFLFFGTTQKIPERKPKKEILLGVAADGSSIYLREIEQMVRFCVTDRFDNPSIKTGVVNFLNDGVIRNDIIKSGLAELLLENDFDRIQPELQAKLSQFQGFSSYIHPQKPSINLENIYARFAPELLETLQKFRTHTEATPLVFSDLISMYQQQQKLQPELIRQYLLYEEKISVATPDPHLINKDLQLFHAYSLDEWFGKKFVELTCQFIHHCASEAVQRGYSIQLDEVKRDLQKKSYEALQTLAGGKKLSIEDFSSYYYQMIHLLGMEEEEVLLIWQKIMLFRRLLQDITQGVVFEGSGLLDYFKYAKEKISITKYQIPKNLIFNDIWDLLQLQFYITKTSLGENALELPSDSLPITEIKSHSPEFIEHIYEICITEKSISDLFQHIPLQEMWKWQINNWALLQDTFPDIRSCISDNPGDQLHYLDEMDHNLRMRIDEFTKKQILKENPLRIEKILSEGTKENRILTIPTYGNSTALKGFIKNTELITFLDKYREKESVIQKVDLDKEIFYQIERVSKKGESIITFARAKEEGILNEFLHRELQNFYDEGLCTEEVLEKPFEEMKELIGLEKYQTLLHQLDNWCIANIGHPAENPDMYIKYRLYPWLHTQRNKLQSSQGHINSTYGGQWNLEKSISILNRSQARSEQIPEENFDAPINSWSPICYFNEEKIGFFQLDNRILPAKEEFTSFILTNQSLLFLEMKHELTRELLQNFPKIAYVDEVTENA